MNSGGLPDAHHDAVGSCGVLSVVARLQSRKVRAVKFGVRVARCQRALGVGLFLLLGENHGHLADGEIFVGAPAGDLNGAVEDVRDDEEDSMVARSGVLASKVTTASGSPGHSCRQGTEK